MSCGGVTNTPILLKRSDLLEESHFPIYDDVFLPYSTKIPATDYLDYTTTNTNFHLPLRPETFFFGVGNLTANIQIRLHPSADCVGDACRKCNDSNLQANEKLAQFYVVLSGFTEPTMYLHVEKQNSQVIANVKEHATTIYRTVPPKMTLIFPSNLFD